jgi:CDP-diacylglycerol--glycerol-3-phosphate 3-phosphatidyltransferase
MIEKKSIPNLLTIGRMAAVPVALGVMLLVSDPWVWLFTLFVFAALTDYLDGYLARKWQATSDFGTLMDPMADKLLVITLLLYLLQMTGLALLPVALIVLREVFIAGLRAHVALKGASVPVSASGKWKTALQMIALALLLAGEAWPVMYLREGGEVLLWASALLGAWSAVEYIRGVYKK